jgi:hypothetical protein
MGILEHQVFISLLMMHPAQQICKNLSKGELVEVKTFLKLLKMGFRKQSRTLV